MTQIFNDYIYSISKIPIEYFVRNIRFLWLWPASIRRHRYR